MRISTEYQRVKAVYASQPKFLEREINKYLKDTSVIADEISFDHGVTEFEGGEKRTYFVAYILYHPRESRSYIDG